MKRRDADIMTEPASQKFAKIPAFYFMLRVGGWMANRDGVFRWTCYEFETGGKKQSRFDWRKVWPKKKK